MVKDNANTGRRSFLKVFGASSGLALLPQVSAKQQPSSAERVNLDTGQYDTIENASVIQKEENSYLIKMGGVVPPGSEAKEYSIDIRNNSHKVSARTEQASVDLQNTTLKQAVPSRENNHLAKNREFTTESTSIGGIESRSSATIDQGSESVGTMGHTGGDSEFDHEGGAWIVTEDFANLNAAKTQYWMDWSTSSGKVDHIQYDGDSTTWEYTVPPSDWNLNDYRYGATDWSGNTAKKTYYSDYINWTWQYNHNKTEAFHRITLVGNPSGYLNWTTRHWHTGEDAGLLHAKAGHYSNYK